MLEEKGPHEADQGAGESPGEGHEETVEGEEDAAEHRVIDQQGEQSSPVLSEPLHYMLGVVVPDAVEEVDVFLSAAVFDLVDHLLEGLGVLAEDDPLALTGMVHVEELGVLVDTQGFLAVVPGGAG